MQRYIIVQDVVHDSFMLVKKEFFSFVASLLQPYMATYQTDNPMMLALNDLVFSQLKLFAQPSVLSTCKSANDLKKIDLNYSFSFFKTS